MSYGESEVLRGGEHFRQWGPADIRLLGVTAQALRLEFRIHYSAGAVGRLGPRAVLYERTAATLGLTEEHRAMPISAIVTVDRNGKPWLEATWHAVFSPMFATENYLRRKPEAPGD